MKLVYAVLAVTLVALVGCSKPTAEEYFAQAQQSAEEARRTVDSLRTVQDLPKLFQPAIDGFTKLIDAYPGSAEAETAQFMVATIRNNDTHEPLLAIEAYKKYAEHYPDGKQAPLAMFLVGYLYNNEVHNLDSAGAAYRRFLEKYPENEMASSAQFELNTLGKSPEELLGTTVADSKPVSTPAAKTTTGKSKKK